MSDDRVGSLSLADQAILDAIHARFLKSRLGQVPAVALAGVLIGKLLGAAEKRGLNWRAVVVGHLPTSIEVARRTWGLTKRDEEAVTYSREHGAEYVTDMAGRMREEIGRTITAELVAGATPQALGTTLMETFGAANRDWRRIALTETATAVSNGYLAQQEPGSLVVGDSAVDCCDWCAEHLQGRVYRMLPEAPAHPTAEESLTCAWVGKTNVGRSKYPVKEDGSARGPGELWHPCIPAHPHCRCRWRQYADRLEEIVPGTNRVISKYNVWGKQ